jgi:DNA polymerase-3 subunit delta
VKIDPRDAERFLRAPGPCRAVLLHGADEGLIRHRGSLLTVLVAGSLTDTFRVAELEREGWPRLANEMSAISMVGGRRVIRVRDATDAILEAVKAALKTAGDGLIVLEAPELGRGKLRPFMEAGSETASLACYPEEGRALQETIRAILQQAGVAAEGEAVAWLGENLGGDRQILQVELEKLILLAAGGKRIDLELARTCVGATATATADASLLAAMAGDLQQADAQIECAIADGLAGVALIRMTIIHLQRLHQARLRMKSGVSASDALKALRPPVFFKVLGQTLNGIALWPAEALLAAIEDARQVEIACKQTGSRSDFLVRRFISGLARQASRRAASQASKAGWNGAIPPQTPQY